jgi:glucosamine-6-phosphate isomerase
MIIKVHSSYDEMSRAAANFIAEYIRNYPVALLCFPSGDTPTGIFKCLVEDAGTGKVDFKDCTFVGLDEWVDLDESYEGSCRHYMDQHLFFPLNIHPDNIRFFNGAADDLDAECDRIDSFIRERGPIDLMMVGLGLNGHVGLNEPGVDFDSYSHVSNLDPKTKHIAKKYFKEEVVLTRGITLGPRHLLESKVAILIATGSKKAEILTQVLQQEVANSIPASIIQKHADAYVFIDRNAAALLSNS